MEDHVAAGHRGLQGLKLLQVATNHFKSWVGRQMPRPARAEVVVNGHFIAWAAQQPLHHVPADKARTARHKALHNQPPRLAFMFFISEIEK